MPLSTAEIEAVLAPFAHASPLPGRAYFDEEVFAFEREHAFRRAWICVGRVDEVELPGAWFRETVAGEAILVVRGADLVLRAFHDVCPHRGMSVVGGATCGRDGGFACPYHGWTFELNGRGGIADLKPARVDTWNGFVFVALKDAGTLADWLESPPPWLVDRPLRRGRRTSWETQANWKLIVENFQESHHFPHVHPSLEAITPTAEACSWIPERGRWLGGTMAIKEGATVSIDRATHGRPLLTEEKRVFDAMLFPALFTSLQPDYLLTYRLTPLAATRTRVTADIYFHPAAFVAGFDPQDVCALWDRVNAEDRAVCESQQVNVHSPAFAPRYTKVEEGVYAFDRMIALLHKQ